MIKARNLKAGPPWSKRYITHVQGLQHLPVISLSQRIPFILVLAKFFSPELSTPFFVFNLFLYFSLFCVLLSHEGSTHLMTRFNPTGNQHTFWDYLFHSSSIFTSTKVSLKYNLNIPCHNLRPCTEEII